MFSRPRRPTLRQPSPASALDAFPGTKSYAVADDKIPLSPGFRIRQGAYFVGSIENVSGTCAGQPRSAINEEATSDLIAETAENGVQAMYPNPSNGQVTITYGEAVTEIIVRDIWGKLIVQERANEAGQNTLDLRAISSGVYLVTFQGSSETLV